VYSSSIIDEIINEVIAISNSGASAVNEDIIRTFHVCFPDVTTHCGCIVHSPVAGFSLLVFEVS
jgi:hypothetical protein